MSKGSIFWGKSRGKLGEMVLSVVKGQETQRAYNGQPANPQTTTQTTQRALFAGAVKFYKSAVANFFPFAFQDKKQQESDYNAFMRYNAKLGMLVTRTQYNNINYPAIGNFQLTQGEMQEVSILSEVGADEVKYSYGKVVSEQPTTAQKVASAFADGYGLEDGDIITIVYIKSYIKDIEDEPSTKPIWKVVQIKVGDTSDARTIANLGTALGATIITSEDYSTFQINTDTDHACATCVIFSRNTPNGLKVSDSYVRMNDIANTIYSESLAGRFRNSALDSWGRKADPILKGSLVPE